MTFRDASSTGKFLAAAAGALAASTVGLAVVTYRLTIRHGQTLLRVEELESQQQDASPATESDGRELLYTYGAPPGSVAMNFDLPALAGGNLTLARFKGRRVLLVFVAPDCPVSRQLLPLLESACASKGESTAEVLIVSTGAIEKNRALMSELGVTLPVVVQSDNEVSLLHYVSGTPMAYLINSDGVTETQRLDGPMAILGAAHLLYSSSVSVSDQALTPVNLEGAPVPDLLGRADDLPNFQVPLLGGGELTSRSLQVGRTLVVLFDPLSQACVDLLPELATIHAADGAPDVVMITRRDPELTRGLSLDHDMQYPIGVQQHWNVSRLFGITAVPAACVVVPGGYLESDLVVGRQAVIDLLKRLRPEPVQRRLVSLTSLVR